MELLHFLPNKSARLIEQVLKSALGNAEDRGARYIDDLVITESRIDGGPIMKRKQAAGKRDGIPDQATLCPHPPDAFGQGRDVGGSTTNLPLRATT